MWMSVHILHHNSPFVLNWCVSRREVEHREEHHAWLKLKEQWCCASVFSPRLLSLTMNRWGRCCCGLSSVPFWISWTDLSVCPSVELVSLFWSDVWSVMYYLSDWGCIILHWPKTKITRLWSRGLKAEREEGRSHEKPTQYNLVRTFLSFYYLCLCCFLVSWII